jgi:hypothetical protein
MFTLRNSAPSWRNFALRKKSYYANSRKREKNSLNNPPFRGEERLFLYGRFSVFEFYRREAKINAKNAEEFLISDF